MAQYQFHGRANRGQPIKGVIEASTSDAVLSQLVGRGITPIKIEEVSVSASLVSKINIALGANKVRSVDLIMFCRQMYTITKAGIPLTRGIRGLAASIRHEHFQEVLGEIADRLEAGASLSVAMRHYPKVFDNLFVSMVDVGESSGKLDEVFRQIGFYIERDEETRKKIKSAMRYPMFVVIALIAAMAVVNVFVIPEFADLFSKFEVELPLITKMLIFTSNMFVNYWMYMLIGVGVAIGACVRYLKTDKGGMFWGQYKMRAPIIGDLIERASMARYSRSLSLMLTAGVPITQSLNLCSSAIDNPYLANKIQKIREGVERGDSMLRTHVQSAMFTPLVLQMISVGEESGQMESLLEEVAEFYEREVDYDLNTLTARLEPILIVVMSAVVLVLALGIFLPMWGMYDVQLGK